MIKEALKPWKILSKIDLFKNERFVATVEKILLPSGIIINDFVQLELPDHCIIIPQLDQDKFLLFRQYKRGPNKVGLYFPAGNIDEGEKPLECAKRELLEETGKIANGWADFGKYTLNGNQGCGDSYLFLAHDFSEPDNELVNNSSDLEEQQIEILSRSDLQIALKGNHFHVARSCFGSGLNFIELDS